MKLALDTNVYRAIADGDQLFAAFLRRANEVALSSITLGEIRAGITCGSKKDSNTAKLEQFLSINNVRVLAADEDTSPYYAAIYAQLRSQGTPIPSNDMWIAATCLQYGFVLATLDSDFRRLPQLQTVGLG